MGGGGMDKSERVKVSEHVCTHLSTGRCQELHKGLDAHLRVILHQVREGGVGTVLPQDHILPITLHLDHVVPAAVRPPGDQTKVKGQVFDGYIQISSLKYYILIVTSRARIKGT